VDGYAAGGGPVQPLRPNDVLLLWMQAEQRGVAFAACDGLSGLFVVLVQRPAQEPLLRSSAQKSM
jgi:hypothetical protein